MKKISGTLSVSVFISLATIAVYLATLRNDFVNWDDDVYVLNNIHLRSLNAAFFRWAFFDFYAANWHPLTWLSHGLDYAVWGTDPAGHHLTSILIHGTNTFLVVLLAIALLKAAAQGPGGVTGPSPDNRVMLTAGGITGALFGMHPLHVESVAWVAERKDLLCGLFFLLAMLAYTRYASAPRNTARQGRVLSRFLDRRYLLVTALFALALLSKPMAVTLPLLLLLLDWYPFGRINSLRSFRDAVIEKVPLLMLSIGSSIVTILAQQAGGTLIPLGMYPLSTRVLVGFQSIIAYLGKMLFPAALSPYYPYPRVATVLSLEFALPVILAAGVTIVCISQARKRPLLPAAWGWYILMLLPVLGIIQVGNQSMADRYTYLPSLGPFLLAGVAGGRAWTMAASRSSGAAARTALAVTGAVLLITLSWTTVKQISIWRNDVRLWSHVIHHDPVRIPIAYNNRGLAYQERGRTDLALADFTTAITLDPSQYAAYLAYVNRGILFKDLGQKYRALEDFNMALILNPSYANAYYNRGWIFAETGQLDRAVEDYTRAIEIDPAYSKAFNNRGAAYEDLQQFDRALADYEQAVRLDPFDYLAYGNRGMVLGRMGRPGEAVESFTRAIEINPDFIRAYRVRGELYAALGLPDRSEQDRARAAALEASAMRTGAGQEHDRTGDR